MLGITFLERSEQCGAEAAHFICEFERFLNEHLRAVRRERLIQAADNAADADAGRCRLYEHAGIDGRIEERQLLEDALDVFAMANLEEPVLDRAPIREQF